MPAYVEAVTEDPIEGDNWSDTSPTTNNTPSTGDEEEDVYARGVQAIASAQKASTSYLQRSLRIGYNNAARLIERMEQDGFVSRPDHVGRREVLVDENGMRR